MVSFFSTRNDPVCRLLELQGCRVGNHFRSDTFRMGKTAPELEDRSKAVRLKVYCAVAGSVTTVLELELGRFAGRGNEQLLLRFFY